MAAKYKVGNQVRHLTDPAQMWVVIGCDGDRVVCRRMRDGIPCVEHFDESELEESVPVVPAGPLQINRRGWNLYGLDG
jgi:hypothetical protein